MRFSITTTIIPASMCIKERMIKCWKKPRSARPRINYKVSAPLVALLIIAMGFLTVGRAFAQDGHVVTVQDVKQEDLDNDGNPDITTIHSSFATDRDLVTVVDQGGNMLKGVDWAEITDFEDDVWLFDAGADGNVDLIIVFSSDDGFQEAWLYTDQDGDGHVAHHLADNGVEILETEHWFARIQSSSSWWLPDGSLNPDITIWVDGASDRNASWDLRPPVHREYAVTDGVVDWELREVDGDSNGIVDYKAQRFLHVPPAQYHTFQDTLYVNSASKQHDRYSGEVFWPFLVGPHGYESYNYFDHFPVVAFDWETGTVNRIGTIGYPIEEGYHINSWIPWEDGVANYASFENPMAYYDLAGDKDGLPELFVRLETFEAFNRENFSGTLPEPTVQVDWSWDQDNNRTWDYHLGLNGRYPITTEVEFQDFSVYTVPYEVLPSWVVEREWDVAVFSAAETFHKWGSEGYNGVWSTNVGSKNGEIVRSRMGNGYATGVYDAPPIDTYQEALFGAREEISTKYLSRPFLYLSPIDRRLHLLNADYGIANLDDNKEVRYENLNQDEHLDSWTVTVDGEVVDRINSWPEYVLYSTQNRFALYRNHQGEELLQTIPPQTTEEWEELATKLPDLSDFPADDLVAMANQYGTPVLEVTGAEVKDFRYSDVGVRFVVALQTDFAANIADREFAELPANPGKYVVTQKGSQLSWSALTLADLRLADLQVSYSGDVPREREWTTIEALVRNDGSEDAADLFLCAVMHGPEDQLETYTASPALLPGNRSESITWGWAPVSAGSWTIELLSDCFETEQGLIEGQFLGEIDIDVAEGPKVSPLWLMSLDRLVPEYSFLLLAVVILLAGSAAFVWLREAGG